MWSASEESSGAMEGGPPEAVVQTKETCKQNKNQLESLKEIMMRNQQSLKRKEEEVQEYARRLSKIKSRAKLSRRSKEGASSSKDTMHSHKTESTAKDVTDDTIDDISQAKTPKAKSSLLQRKLVENRKVFEQRSKELTETKRAVEEKVEAIRQQLDETAAAEHKDQLAITSVRPLVVTSDVIAPVQIQNIQEKEKKIMELNSKIVELEATILDLQENLKEKDSVIDSKMKAVTLMSANLSKKGKTTLDTLEDTKDEMRTMQENFILIETSLKNKNANLLEQLEERDNKISELEHRINRFEEQLKEQKVAELASADFSRSTMDTLMETKDVMKSMQENFILVESSLKLKNDNLLQQLGEYEIKLAEAKERIFQLESGAGIVTIPAVEDLQFRIEKLEQDNRQLLDEKYELQKNIAELQDKIVANKLHDSNDAIVEKDNRIAELENLIDELKQSNKLLEEESKTELQKQVAELSSKNEEHSNKITDLERQVHELEAEKNDIATRLSAEQAVPKEDVVIKLTKELEDLNKSMIKLKAQHRSKVKNLQKQLENFKMVSDTNAELVRLGNQVALLEEEKGNLQLSLVDFDELKASAGDWQERVADLESKVSSQTKEIQMHIDAIAILENQKLDLTQELHTVKQEILGLEAENAESENLRVTAEIKVVELEEQLETAHKEQSENKLEIEHHELLKKLDALTQENSELYNKLNKMEEKGTSDTGSTESFEAIQMNDRNDLLKKIEDLEQKNNELMLKISKFEEKDGSHAGSTESFETINDTDRSELIKKIEQLTQENSDLTMKLSRIEEKGSSDTGSTESFERIPEHNDSPTKIEILTQENNELVIKLTKLEERLHQIESSAQLDISKIDHNLETFKDDSNLQIETLTQENDNLLGDISQFKSQLEDLTEENNRLQDRIEILTAENTELVINRTKLEERLQMESSRTSQMSIQMIESADQINALIERQQILEKELAQLRKNSIEHSVNVTSCETDDAKSKLATLEKENVQMTMTITQLEERINSQTEDLIKITREKEELDLKLERMTCDDFSREKLELMDKLEKLYREKENIAHERHELYEQISIFLQKSSDEILEMRKTEEVVCQESQTVIVASLEKELENSKILIVEYKNQIEEMNMKLESMETELQKKTKQLQEYEVSGVKLESLESELKDMFVTAEEWKFKYDGMQEKMQALEQGKASMEEAFKTLENGNKELLEVIKEKDAATDTLQEHLQGIKSSFETRLRDEMANVTAKEHEIANLKAEIEKKDQELHIKYAQLQNGMITIDSLQDELNNYSIKLKENEAALSSSLGEVARLNDITKEKEQEIYTLKDNISKITEMLEQSKSVSEFEEILENLRNKETSFNELQNKYEEALKENNESSQNIEDMIKRNEIIETELIKKEQEIDSLLVAKKDLDAQIEEIKNDKIEAEKRIWELQAILDNQTTYAEKVQSELANEYKQMERLKTKHMEDIAMLNRRLEDVIEELVEKTQENEAMKVELEQKELLGKNVTEETILESKVADLEQKLLDSENKLQAQSEKMKKIVATFNKKKIACQELEARVAELQEKWTTEKDEKEVKNKQIQEVEISMREKDNKIHDLEEKLLQAKNDTAEILANSEKFEKELISLKEKIAMLMEHVTEMDEEIEKQRAEIENLSLEVTMEKTLKQDIIKEYEFYKQTVSKEDEQKQGVLDEVKEQARELSVRMQVMETEYVEQLAAIKNLKAENGLLLSKRTQIDEKLENAEKKSEERRVLIEQLQKEIATMASMTVTTQIPEQSELRDDDARIAQHCDHSEQCQNLVQALEARLQERQAEIENLNNELANSYGNIVLLHDESQRYNDMMMQTAQERFNQSLMDQTNTLQQEINSLKTEKAVSEQRVLELEAELEEYKRENAECKVEIPKEVEIPIIKNQQKEDTLQLFDTAKIIDTVASDMDTSDKKEIERLQSLLIEKQSQCSGHIQEMDLLLNNIKEERLHIQELQDQFKHSQSESKKIENLLSEKNAQIDLLNTELDNVIHQMNDLKMLREEYHTAETESQRLQQLVTDKSTQIELLITELNTVNQQMSSQLEQHADVEAGLRTEISLKDTEITAIKTELTFMKQTIEALTMERDQQVKSYKLHINNLETKVKSSGDNDLIQEWEQRISATTTERDLLQLQVNDLTRSLEELKESLASQRNLQIEFEKVLRERDQAQVLIANLTQALDDSKQSLQESKVHEDSLKELTSMEKSIEQELEHVSTAVKETTSQQECIQLEQDPIRKEIQQEIQLDIGWDNDSENLNVDEESWGWSAENVQSIVSSQHLSTMTLSAEMRLRAKVEDLENKIKDLEAQNVKIVEENKAAQVKSGKLVKKLKEYKVRIEGLQQQLKTQKQAHSFFDLDTAIEEELKAQIANLEKAFSEIKEEKKNINTEKEALLKRLDVIVSANERYMEIKERQDMEVEVLRIQNKELGNKIQSLEWQLQENAIDIEDTISSSPHEDQSDQSSHEIDKSVAHSQFQKRTAKSNDDIEVISKKYKEKIDDLKDELEALAAENEQLQHFLEEQKAAMANLEPKDKKNTDKLIEKLDALNNQNTQLQSTLNKSKEEYNVLRKQYEQSLIDANDQVTTMRQNSDLLKIEFAEKVNRLETEIDHLHRALEEKKILEDNALSSEEKLSAVNASLMEVTELLNARVQEVADLKQELQVQYVERQQAEEALQSKIQNLIKELDEKKHLETLNQASSDREHELIEQRSVEAVNIIVSEATQELVQKHVIEIEGKDKELRDLTEKLSVLQSTVDEYILKLQDYAIKLETQQQQIAYLKEDLTERNSIIGTTQTDMNLMNEKLREKQQELIQYEEEKTKLATEVERCLADIQRLQNQLNATEVTTIDLQECNSRIHSLEQEAQILKSEKESILLQCDQETNMYRAQIENDKEQINALKYDLREKTEQLHYMSTQLCVKENDLEGIRAMMSDKDSLLEITYQELNDKRAEVEKLRNEQSVQMIDSFSVSKIGHDDDAELQSTINELKAQMEAKQQELEHMKYVLSENTYPTIIQQMQDRINYLYNEKATLEASLQATTESLTEKQEQVNLLTQRINGQNQEYISKEEASLLSRDRRSMHDQEEIVRLQNELHTKQQEINELKYIIAEKDSQLCLQATMEPQSDDFELRETVQRLMGELYNKEQEVQMLKSTIAEQQEQILQFKDYKRLSEESRNAIEGLTLEKEQIRIDAEEFLNRQLQKKESEIDEIKQRLSEENQKLLAELRLKDSDIENLKAQFEQLRTTVNDRDSKLQQKETELIHTIDDLAEKERRLAELSITKDTELYNLKVQIQEKEARIDELLTLSTEEEKQLDELRQTLATSEIEVDRLKKLLVQKVHDLIEHGLNKDVETVSSKTVQSVDNKETISSELDLALYMLHQRDVRCEELTHELMQLLEERDTLQLRLSNAIRVNEELRRVSNTEASLMKDSSSSSRTIIEPLVEQPSPSKSEGPVEIAKEAIDTPIEDKEALALKLSQLHSVSHSKDVRLKDERELRHTQQMSLLTHRDVLNTLPPEAAARLVNANYTLSRDVQSQSSVLLNWLWGKSTPKVMHM